MEKFIVTECPTCHGDRRIYITDYIDHSLKYEWPIPCPVCAGGGVVHSVKELLGLQKEVAA